MTMRACSKCLENNWAFKKKEGECFATCQNCGNEVSWVAKDKTHVIWKVGDMCRSCNQAVMLAPSKFKQKKLTKNYYYSHYLRCPNRYCSKIYFSDDYKVYPDQIPTGVAIIQPLLIKLPRGGRLDI